MTLTHLLVTYLPTYLPSFLLPYLPTSLPPYLPTYLPTYLPAYPSLRHTYLLTYLPTYLPTFLTSLPTYLPSCLPFAHRHTLDRRLEGFHDFLQLAVAITPMPRAVLAFLELPPSHPVASLAGVGTGGSATTSSAAAEGTRSGMRLVNQSTSDTVSPTNTSALAQQLPLSKLLSSNGEQPPPQHHQQQDNNNESLFNSGDTLSPQVVPTSTSNANNNKSGSSNSNNYDTKDENKSGISNDSDRKQSQGQGLGQVQGLGQSMPTKIPSESNLIMVGEKQGGVNLSLLDQQVRYESEITHTHPCLRTHNLAREHTPP